MQLVPLPPDADDVEVGDSADFQLKTELGQTTGVVNLAPEDVAFLLALDTLHTISCDVGCEARNPQFFLAGLIC
jgi:hypothetical protein